MSRNPPLKKSLKRPSPGLDERYEPGLIGTKSGKGTWKRIIFDDIYHLDDAHCSNFAVSELKQRGSIVHFEKVNDYILIRDGPRLDLVEYNDLYYFHLEDFISPDGINCMVAMTKSQNQTYVYSYGENLSLRYLEENSFRETVERYTIDLGWELRYRQQPRMSVRPPGNTQQISTRR